MLATELGIEPGPELVELENKVLTQDASLAAPVVDAAPSPERHRGTVVEPLPSGTVTFLLTDIAGSTALWDLSPDQMAKALVRHEDVIAEVVDAHDGRLLKSRGEGDATLSVFAKGTDAVAGGSAPAALAQRDVARRPRPADARSLLHTGEAQLREGDYYGGTLNRAARIRGIAEGGEILLSRSTHDLVADVVADDIELVALGEHEMRGMRRSELVYGIAGPGLHLRDAPRVSDAASAVRVPGNLPLELTNLVGRDDQLPELHTLVRTHRLVTLTGAGGVGKTRLVFHVAADLAGEFPDGIWVVEFAPVADPAAVPDAVAAALRVTQLPSASPTDAVFNEVLGPPHVARVRQLRAHPARVADFADLLVTVPPTRCTCSPRAAKACKSGPSTCGRFRRSTRPVRRHRPSNCSSQAWAVCPTFELGDPADAAAVTEICQSLDGLASRSSSRRRACSR